MSTKMKGLFKGLRYISQIFEDDQQQKEQDMQIGLPTDVKHVAHVGWDDPPSANSSPDSPDLINGDAKTSKENADVKWVSEDSKRVQRTKKSQEKDAQQQNEGPKPSRRRSTDNNPLDTSPKKPSRRQSSDNKNATATSDTSAKPRQPRRNHPKDLSDSAAKDSDPLKKTRRKKAESADQAGPRRPRNKAASNGGDAAAEPGPESGTAVQKSTSELSSVEEDREENGRAGQVKEESLQN